MPKNMHLRFGTSSARKLLRNAGTSVAAPSGNPKILIGPFSALEPPSLADA